MSGGERMTAITDDDVSRQDVAEALANMNAYVKRQMHHKDNPKYVEGHKRLNDMLSAWEQARA
jgi:hypothetical protein